MSRKRVCWESWLKKAANEAGEERRVEGKAKGGVGCGKCFAGESAKGEGPEGVAERLNAASGRRDDSSVAILAVFTEIFHKMIEGIELHNSTAGREKR